MKWSRRLQHLLKDPTTQKQIPGFVHVLTLNDEIKGKQPFQMSTMMYIPDGTDPTSAKLSLQMFEDEGRTQLRKLHDKWRGRDVTIQLTKEK